MLVVAFRCTHLILLLLIILFLITAAAVAEPSKEINFPQKIPLFTTVHFHSPRASFLQIRHENRSICSLNAMGDTTFPCRCFGFPSDNYQLLVDTVLKLKFSVVSGKEFWKIPENSTICQPLVIEFDREILCNGLNLSLQLQYTPAINTRKEDDLRFTSEIEVPVEKTLILPCQYLCLPGIYRIALMNNELAVQVSKAIKLQKTDEISITLPRPHIFPRCFEYLKITWTDLSCPVRNLEFKMRLFAIPEGSNFEQSYYMEEYDIDLSEQALELPCYQFDIIYAQFCFEVVSVQKGTARFAEWARRCAHTENLGQIEGGWRDWSTWSTCSVTCGQGLQRRWRLCDSPAPKNGGNLCEGKFVETLHCDAGNCTELTTTATVSDTSCFCGCMLSHKSGRFFARTCGNITEWILKPYGKFLSLILRRESISGKCRLGIYRGMKKEELVYDSGTSPILESSLFLPADDYFVISIIDLNSSSIINSGVEISYDWKNESEAIALTEIAELKESCVFCHRNLPLLLAGLFSILIAFIPPLLCAYATILIARRSQRRRNQQLNISRSLEESGFDLNMIRSGQTDTTEVKSNKTVITKRSIGIQLSASSTPRFPRYKDIFGSRATNSPQMTPRIGEHSSLSFSTDHDLEYDYYEPAVPGSFLTPAFDFYSDIDIEQIIGSSVLSHSVTPKHDAHTQIDDDT